MEEAGYIYHVQGLRGGLNRGWEKAQNKLAADTEKEVSKVDVEESYTYETNSTCSDDSIGTGFIKCNGQVILHTTSNEGKKFLKKAVKAMKK